MSEMDAGELFVQSTYNYPMWDDVNKQVYYLDVQGEQFNGYYAGEGGVSSVLMMLSALNKLNPAWYQNNTAVAQPPQQVSGEGVINIPNATSVQVYVLQYPQNISRWWGGAQLGKFGVIMFRDQQLCDIMPVKYVNSTSCRIDNDSDADCAGVHYSFPPGVNATIVVYAEPANNVNKIPGVGWNVNGNPLNYGPLGGVPGTTFPIP